MTLTDVAIRKALPGEKPYKLTDGRGLFLLVTVKGAKSWRFRYSFDGREKLLTFGLYPEVKLTEARDRRDDAREQLRRGIDPGAKAEGQASLEAVARRWHSQKAPTWSAHHAADVLKSLEAEAFPAIGDTPVDRVSIADVAKLLEKIEDRGAIETAHRVRQRLEAVFAFAGSKGMTDKNPAAMAKAGMAKKPKGRKQPAITELDDARAMLAAALAMPAQPITRDAVLLLALTAVRPGELRRAEWREFDEDADEPMWTVPAERMKGDLDRKADQPHLVPLAPAAVAAVKRLRALSGHGDLVFPSIRHAHRPMSENAIG